MTRVAICIPAYNRGPYLPELLDSIRRQWVDGLQVVVADNGSTDDTAAVLRDWQGRLPSLVVVRHGENIGPDRNFLSVVAAADAEFCWLMGSDDRIEPGGIDQVLRGLDTWPEAAGLSVNMAAYDVRFEQPLPIGKPVDLDADQLVRGTEEAILTFVPHLGYLSGHVVRRSLWNEVCATGEPERYLNAYVHVLVMARMIQRRPAWGYIHQRCVGWRSGNDSFMADGWFNRMRIDVVGYSQIAEALFGPGSRSSRIMRGLIARTHIMRHYSYAKTHGASKSSLRASSALFWRHLRDTGGFWTHLVPWMLAPQPALASARAFYRRLKSGVQPSAAQ